MKMKKVLANIGYVLGIVFCLAVSVSLVYGSYLMINWSLSEHPDYVYSDYGYSDPYATNYVYDTTCQASDTIIETIDGETVFFQQLGFDQYTGAIQVSYDLSVPADGQTGLEIYFLKSEAGYYEFTSAYDAVVSIISLARKRMSCKHQVLALSEIVGAS